MNKIQGTNSRFQICCDCCGLLEWESHKVAGINRARFKSGFHNNVILYDAMAKAGNVEKYHFGSNGDIIKFEYKESEPISCAVHLRRLHDHSTP
jgi:hypothetical protein